MDIEYRPRLGFGGREEPDGAGQEVARLVSVFRRGFQRSISRGDYKSGEDASSSPSNSRRANLPATRPNAVRIARKPLKNSGNSVAAFKMLRAEAG